MSIDINRISEIRSELEALGEREILYVNEDGKARFVIMPVEMYDSLEELSILLDSPIVNPQVKVVSPDDFELSYDEYERVKNQIMEIVEKTLMPKPEKLN